MNRLRLPSVLGALLVWAVTLAGETAHAANDLPFAPADNERWILVETSEHKLVVYTGERPTAEFPDIAVGQGGVAENRRRGDRTTPKGKFRISWVHDESRYHLFLGLNYPTLRHADAAFQSGAIDREEYGRFLSQYAANGHPPQTTSLGGHIGIHGVGRADEGIHRVANWTDGCVALEDSQIEALWELVGIGTRVVIR